MGGSQTPENRTISRSIYNLDLQTGFETEQFALASVLVLKSTVLFLFLVSRIANP